jgi:transcriptional/translational regulatory protein YebC/TACO1
MNTAEFNERLESLIDEAANSGMSDEQIARLINQQLTAIAGNKQREDRENFDQWKAIQQSTLSIRTLL